MTLGPAEVARALAAVPRLAAAGGFDLELLHRHDGLLTSAQQVEVRWDGHVERFWVKQSRQAGHAEREWRFLRDPVEAAGVRTVEPVALVAERGLLVTEHAEGRPMTACLEGDGPWAPAEAAARAGAWLAALHGPPAGGGPHPRAAIVDDVEERLRAAGVEGAEVVAAVERLLAEVTDLELERVRTHGDYSHFNIVVRDDGQGAVVLDPSFETSIDRQGGRCARAEDAARFLVGVELALDADADACRDVAAAMAGAYAAAAAPLAPAALQALAVKYRAQALVDRWPAAVAAARPGAAAWLLRVVT